MRCLVAFSRHQAGRAPMRRSPALDRSSRRKSADLLRCDQFDHEACGRPFTYWMERVGYLQGRCWRAAENITFGTGTAAVPRQIFDGWIHSIEHRRNILGPLRDFGLGLRIGVLDGFHGAHVWTQQFGTLC